MADATSPDSRIGSEIAGYRVERLLGRGGMSVVYLAHDPRLDRRVALKLLAPELAEDERFRERFLRESKLAASLDHPNVIPIHEAGEADGVLFIAMRFVEGGDLAERLARDGWLEPAGAVSILDRVAEALDAAHRRGLVHRDVKPGNVLLSDEGHVYLSDFGLTRRTEETAALTESGEFVGTLDYVAPEQIENKDVSAATDAYALSCVFFQCLTGEVPFRADTNVGVLWSHLEDEPPSASETNPELPSAIDGVLVRGMAKEPGDRYATCGELAQGARSALDLSGELTAPAVAPRRGRARLLTGVAALAVVVVAAVLAVVFLTGGGADAAVGEEWTRVPGSEAVFGGVSGVQRMEAVASDGEQLVAVGWDDSSGDADAAVWLSPDGESWARVEPGAAALGGTDSQIMRDVTASEGGFVAVGTQQVEGFRTDAVVWLSVDGQVWERVSDAGPGVNPDRACVTSELDRTRFQAEDEAPATNAIKAVVAGSRGLLAVGFGGCEGELQAPTVWASNDARTWERTHLEGEGSMNGLVEGDGLFVAVGVENRNAAVWVSTDAGVWDRVPSQESLGGSSPEVFVEMNAVVAVETGFVAVGSRGSTSSTSNLDPADPFSDPSFDAPFLDDVDAAVWTSADGLTWTRIEDPVDVLGGEGTQTMSDIVVADDGLVAVGFRETDGDQAAAVWLSDDGSEWRLASDPTGALQAPDDQFLRGAVAGGPGVVAVGGDGTLFDIDAAVWTSP